MVVDGIIKLFFICDIIVNMVGFVKGILFLFFVSGFVVGIVLLVFKCFLGWF